MKNLLIYLTVFFLAFELYAQSDAQKLVDEHNALFVKYAMGNNVEAQTALYTEDALSLPSYMPMIKGIDALRKSGEESRAMGIKFTRFELTTVELIEAGDYIIDVGTYSMTMEGPGFPGPWDDNGKYITIFEKQGDGSIKIKVDTWNSDINPWEMMNDMGEEGDMH